ncbi:hypothetical protein [Streptomyces sp. OK228]|uniref:hypothetical protein n=1 Tax=Streptomyces sp. OK228 TaxID=1882786 RepID=UPI000BCDD91B|nr:hypothetical protein [Streptomyces sp. OK228]SOE31804.1 hypothetical protein SAMN05442782_8738 [Streptomyces sp. OK228]
MAQRTGAPLCGTPPCTNTGRLVGGRCEACYRYARRHGVDPATRPGLRPVPASCTVTEDGVRCSGAVANRLRGLCKKHDTRRRRHGDPAAKTRTTPGAVMAFLRDAAHAATDNCLVPPGAEGRGALARYAGKRRTAARVVWMLRHGDPGADVSVLHRCNGGSGTNGCVNIRHLYADTPAQNSRDMVEAERSNRGEDRPDAKLTEDDVRAIRRRYVPRVVTQQRLADEYGVDQTTVSAIIRREKWAWLAD